MVLGKDTMSDYQYHIQGREGEPNWDWNGHLSWLIFYKISIVHQSLSFL